ncbi:MAG: hypothetical protein ED555_03335 [Allomuricauda sp.]|nr:MAG: hypothetical protein ED555_03335 [Allomuricauda sp.]
MDKYDKEIFFEYLWKVINYFYWILIIASVFVGIRALIYVLEGMIDSETSKSGLIKVSTFIVVYVLARNLIKPYFMKKMNKS